MTPGWRAAAHTSAQPSGVTCPAQGGPGTGSCASPMNPALRGVSSSPHCSQGLADTFLPSCLFGIQRDDPKPRLILLYPVREDKPYLAPRAPRAHGCVGSPPGRFCATGSVHLPWRQQSTRLHHPSWTLSWDGEASSWTDTCAQGGAGQWQAAHGHSV